MQVNEHALFEQECFQPDDLYKNDRTINDEEDVLMFDEEIFNNSFLKNVFQKQVFGGKIKQLHLSQCSFDDNNVLTTFLHLIDEFCSTSLEVFYLHETLIPNQGKKAMVETLRRCRKLCRIKFIKCDVGNEFISDLSCLFSQLSEFDVSGNEISHLAVLELCERLKASPKTIRQIDLASCGLKDISVTLLAETIVYCTELRWIRLSQNEMTNDSGIHLLDALRQNTSIRWISLFQAPWRYQKLISDDLRYEILRHCRMRDSPRRKLMVLFCSFVWLRRSKVPLNIDILRILSDMLFDSDGQYFKTATNNT
jgi:hypothetical protein